MKLLLRTGVVVVAAVSVLTAMQLPTNATTQTWDQGGEGYEDISVDDADEIRIAAPPAGNQVHVLDSDGVVRYWVSSTGGEDLLFNVESVDIRGDRILKVGSTFWLVPWATVTDKTGHRQGVIVSGGLNQEDSWVQDGEIWAGHALVVEAGGVNAYDLESLAFVDEVVSPFGDDVELYLGGNGERLVIGSFLVDEITFFEIGSDLEVIRTVGPIVAPGSPATYGRYGVAPAPDGGYYWLRRSSEPQDTPWPVPRSAPTLTVYSSNGIPLESVEVLPETHNGISMDVDRCFNAVGASISASDEIAAVPNMGFKMVPTNRDPGCFVDTSTHLFGEDIVWLGRSGITRGCTPPLNDRFCPDTYVTRGQVAAFLARALDLPATNVDAFVDDDESVFENDINRMAAAGITKGCNPPDNDRFCPDDKVRREVMAAFLVRALGYTDDGGGDLFNDDDGSIFETDIDRLATAGVTKGCNPPTNDRFCPTQNVTRGQMAAFLHRALS